jgi:hypothetical protein
MKLISDKKALTMIHALDEYASPAKCPINFTLVINAIVDKVNTRAMPKNRTTCSYHSDGCYCVVGAIHRSFHKVTKWSKFQDINEVVNNGDYNSIEFGRSLEFCIDVNDILQDKQFNTLDVLKLLYWIGNSSNEYAKRIREGYSVIGISHELRFHKLFN